MSIDWKNFEQITPSGKLLVYDEFKHSLIARGIIKPEENIPDEKSEPEKHSK